MTYSECVEALLQYEQAANYDHPQFFESWLGLGMDPVQVHSSRARLDWIECPATACTMHGFTGAVLIIQKNNPCLGVIDFCPECILACQPVI